MPAPVLTLHLGSVPNNYANPNVLNRPGSPTATPSNQVQMSPGQNWGWANVGNTGDASTVATVTYYFCTPGGPVDKWKYFLNNQIGTATLTVPPSPTAGQQATSNASWAPTVHAHTCMIAVVESPDDQLPPGFMDPEEAPEIANRHVGQQNLVIIQAPVGTTQTVRFRAPEQPGSTLRVVRGDAANTAAHALVQGAGAATTASEFGFVGGLVRDLNAPTAEAVTAARAEPGGVRELTVGEGEEGFRDLEVRVPADAQPGSHDFLGIETVRDGRVVAGLGVLVQVVQG